MKAYKLSGALILFMLLSIAASAQDDREDVVYLKNGTIYHGVIIEQVPGESLKIEIAGGTVFSVQITDVAKIAREKKPAPPLPPPYRGDMYRDDFHREHFYHHPADSSHTFHYRNKGYFFQAQLLMEAVEGGARIVNGYKFNRFAYLGVGIGADILFENTQRNADYAGVYLPLYIYYGGDILKGRITPFYSLELGYSIRPGVNNNGNGSGFPGVPQSDPNAVGGKGGVMGGAGFGVKFRSRRKAYFSLSAHLDFQNSANYYTSYIYNPYGYGYSSSYTVTNLILIPGLRFGVGF
jgi:hypothetical protein